MKNLMVLMPLIADFNNENFLFSTNRSLLFDILLWKGKTFFLMFIIQFCRSHHALH